MWRGVLCTLGILVISAGVQLVLRPDMVWVPFVFAIAPVAVAALLRGGNVALASVVQMGGWLLLLAALWGPTGGLQGALAAFVLVGAVWCIVYLDPVPAGIGVTGHLCVIALDAPLRALWQGVSWVEPETLATNLAASHGLAVLLTVAMTGTLLSALERQERHADTRSDDARSAETRAVAAASAKSKFLATMSHELRTPLNAILGYADLLAEDADPSEHADLQGIARSGRHLQNLVDDVLEVARAESTTPDPQRSTDLRPVLEVLKEQLRVPVPQLGADQSSVRVHPESLSRMLGNLTRQYDAISAIEARLDDEVCALHLLGPPTHNLNLWIAQRLAATQGGALDVLHDRVVLRLMRAA